MKPHARGALALLLALIAAAGLIAHAAGAAVAKDSLQSVSEALTCQCGCGLTVANCNHPQCEFSVPVREQIEKMLGKGMGRAQIIALFRAKYGEKILSAPTTEGFNLLAWVMPFAALLAGCGIVFAFVGRWHKQGAEPERPAESRGEGGGFDAELRRRLERDIRERF